MGEITVHAEQSSFYSNNLLIFWLMTRFKDTFCSVLLQTVVCCELSRSPHKRSDFGLT